MPILREEADYEVRNGDVFLSVFIGDGQFGRTDVLLDGERILRATGDITSLRIGPGADLKGSELRINTLGVDVNTDHNRLGVTYELTGGRRVLEFGSPDAVVKDFGSIVFMTRVFFV